MKLELKHLAPYLPFGLRITKEDWGKTFKMDCDGTTLNCIGIDYILHTQAKPILKKLRDLTDDEIKEIYNDKDIDVVRMKYAIVINYKMMGEWFKQHIPLYKIMEDDESNLVMSAWLYNRLLENHYDMFGLIEKKLAINSAF